MRILFISNDLIGGNLAHILTQEGHQVKLYIHDKDRRRNFENLVLKIADWKDELKWVKKDGLIVFDDVNFGFIQDSLRKEGYRVFGGSEKGDTLELNRKICQDIFAKYGINTLPIKNFKSASSAIQYVRKNPKAWVVKQNGGSSKSINYVGHFNDGRDVIDVLKSYKENNSHDSEIISLQEKVYGIEIAVTRYFNGMDWVGPILMNMEHKKFFPGDLGPTTSEMGTLGWYDSNEENKLFQETLCKLKPYLKKINYRGIIDINCIVNENGALPLEATSRLGSPIVHLQTELNTTPWAKIMSSIAEGGGTEIDYKKGYGIVVVVAVPPFPYTKKLDQHSQIGTHIYLDESMTDEDMSHIHFEEVSLHKPTKRHYISDDRGYVLYVTGNGTSAQEARKKAYEIIHKIHIPKMFYRNDIGQRFIENGYDKLSALGYIN